MNRNETITLTFGDAGENHAGMKIIGKIGDVGSGFTFQELETIKQKFIQENYLCELKNLNDLYNEFPEDFNEEASILIIRNGIDFFIKDKGNTKQFFEEMNTFKWDDKYYDTRRSKVLNKRARTNVCFGQESIEPDYENKQGRIIAYDDVPLLKLVKLKLPLIIGNKGKDLICEGNRYYDIKKCGIGWHGDSERKKVIGLRLGCSIPLKYKWYFKSKSIGESYTIDLNDGDIYIMSEKATGYDWKYRSKYTLRHCAGCNKYTKEK